MATNTTHSARTDCPIAYSLDILGDHWTLIIIRYLMFGGLHEYKDMIQMDEQISTSILSRRLKNLEKHKVISSIPHPDSGKRKLYYLTEMGKDLIHVMVALVLWGDKHITKLSPETVLIMQEAPDAFKSSVLQRLDEWEARYL